MPPAYSSVKVRAVLHQMCMHMIKSKCTSKCNTCGTCHHLWRASAQEDRAAILPEVSWLAVSSKTSQNNHSWPKFAIAPPPPGGGVSPLSINLCTLLSNSPRPCRVC
eukprot:jgi/Botrbrau1/22898/Bobra.0065s0051.1